MVSAFARKIISSILALCAAAFLILLICNVLFYDDGAPSLGDILAGFLAGGFGYLADRIWPKAKRADPVDGAT